MNKIKFYPGVAMLIITSLLAITGLFFFKGSKLLVENPIHVRDTTEKIVYRTIVKDIFVIEGDGYKITKDDDRYIVVSGNNRYEVAVKLATTIFNDNWLKKPSIKENRKFTIILLIDAYDILQFFEYWNEHQSEL